jgi:hypothetical protein
MPKNVRNFWVNVEVDGRSSALASGPVAKDGGFTCGISVRHKGEVCNNAVMITGRVNPDGTLEIKINGFDPETNARIGTLRLTSER